MLRTVRVNHAPNCDEKTLEFLKEIKKTCQGTGLYKCVNGSCLFACVNPKEETINTDDEFVCCLYGTPNEWELGEEDE